MPKYSKATPVENKMTANVACKKEALLERRTLAIIIWKIK
jgi:hypothetical protein